MQLLVFSDSHNHIAPMAAKVRSVKPDLILHLGDYASDARSLADTFPHIPLRAVRGNCDFGSRAPLLEEVLIADKRIVMAHGHRYEVKSDYGPLYHMGREAGADILLFGHTHIPHYEQVGAMHVLNPGSAGRRTLNGALIRIVDGAVHCEHISL